MDTELRDHDLGLILKQIVFIIILGSQDDDTVVADVFDVWSDLLEGLSLVIVLEEVSLLLNELSQDVVQKLHDIWQILSVWVQLGADTNDLSNGVLLNQLCKESLVLTELLEDRECI